jgi:glycosyltransferase involved in cell wall biosynthesis
MRVIVRQAPMLPGFAHMDRVAVVLPAFNEEANIEHVVREALRLGVGRVVCVDDCSTDGTGVVIEELAEQPQVQAVRHEVNQGKQAAVRHGLQAALQNREPAIFAVLDADRQNDPALLEGLCGHLETHDMVIARRATARMTPARRLANALANMPYRIIAATGIHDVQSGYRLYRRDAAEWLARHLTDEGRYTLEHVSLLELGRMALCQGRDLQVAEVEIPYRVARAESSIRVRDNLQLTWASIYYAAGLAGLRLTGQQQG